MKNSHTDRKFRKDFICHICSKAFATKSTLKIHEDALHSTIPKEEAEKFECTYPDCGKKFSSAYKLKAHEEGHAPRNLYCRYCSMAFQRKQILKKHLFHIHTNADLRAHKCPYPGCEAAFKRRCDAKQHYESLHDLVAYGKPSNIQF
jgi:uncharacterized Zn-finger protein